MGYIAAIVLEAAVTAFLLLLQTWLPLGRFPVLYFLATGIIAYAFGAGPAILAFILGVLAFDYFFIDPVGTLWPIADSPLGWAGWSALLIGTSFSAVAMTVVRQSQQHTREALAHAERELTVRKQAEQSLRERAEELETVMEVAPVAIWIGHDPETREITGNRMANEFYEAEPGENVSATTVPIRRFFRDGRELAPEELPMQEAAARNADVRNAELDVLLPSGRWRYMLGSASPLRDAEGRVRGTVGAFVDITERKEAEEALRASEERYRKLSEELDQRVAQRTEQLEAANKELEAFSYSVSHDLRAPLRIIDGFSLALLEDYEDKLDAEGKSYLNFLRDSAQRMAQLIDDVLRLSRIGRAEIEFEKVDLSATAISIITGLQHQDTKRHMDVTVQPGLTVCADTDLIRLVLENLLGNAWKYTSKTPDARIEFGMTVQDDERVYYVRDNGAGFDMAYVDRLFAPFQRLHTEAEFPGTGIGLSIVRRIIARHGGRVWAEGEVGKGATFYFTLPTEGNC